VSAAVWVVGLAPLAFVAAALVARRQPDVRPTGVIRANAAASGLGLATAAGAGVAVAVAGPVVSPTIGVDGFGLSLRLDPLSVTMFGMIAFLAAVIVRYSATYLDGNERHGAFLGRLAATIAAVELLVLSGNLVVLVAAWIATSLALHQLLVFHRDRPRAVAAARKKWIVARTGDAFLIAAAVLLAVHFGTGDLGTIFADMTDAGSGWSLGPVGVAAACLALAALLKSAQFPTHGWLVEVMETPTPVSALLHAGILNAGPFLAIRMAAVVDGGRTATMLLILVGGFTAIFASVVLLTQPSIKVVLGYSSVAHMGFMLLVCGMGFYPAALLHLVAHSFYKAHAFLSSGSVVDETRAAKVRLPRRLGSPWRIAAAAGVALALYLPLAILWGVDFDGNPLVIAIGGILVLGTTQLLVPAFDSAGRRAAMARAALLALAVTLAFFGLEAGAHALLAGTVPEAVARDGAQIAAILAVLAGFTIVVGFQLVDPARPPSPRRRALAVHLRNGLYANAWFDRTVGAFRPSPAP
jgi:NAD(P)H-quinone oxidoreductase subunit 5